jgi:hypothetical protein
MSTAPAATPTPMPARAPVDSPEEPLVLPGVWVGCASPGAVGVPLALGEAVGVPCDVLGLEVDELSGLTTV